MLRTFRHKEASVAGAEHQVSVRGAVAGEAVGARSQRALESMARTPAFTQRVNRNQHNVLREEGHDLCVLTCVCSRRTKTAPG